MKSLFLTAVALSGLLQSVHAVTGDTQCEKAMCVTAINHNNATTSYDLTVSESQVGWMAVGFGRSMIVAPMVILWKDSTGSTVVSQRKASDFVMPTVDPNPPMVATALNYRSSSNSTAQTLSFSVPSTTATRMNLIWAWAQTPPSGDAPDSTIVQHDDDGELVMDMTIPLPDSIDGPTSAGSSPTATVTLTPSYGNDFGLPLTSSQKVFIAHGVLLTVAFMIILPLGVLQARLLRTFVPGKWWFGAHWILQWPVATALIVVGFALAVNEMHKLQSGHVNSKHKIWGFILICLYIAQCSLGGFIHFVKSAKRVKRPPQNYLHAVLGLIIIGLSFWQVHTGIEQEWLRIGGSTVPKGYGTWWKVWIVIIISLYLIGLVLLPRQYRMEADQQRNRQIPVKTFAPKSQNQFEYEA